MESSMKIEGQRTDLLNQALDRVGQPTPATGNQTPTSAFNATSGDAVQLSDDAQLMQAATKAADQAPAIRQDVVEKMRAALANGEIGNDAQQLADSMLNHWITK
jgi:negative regulator of flagellin synthesis FlgM